MFMINEM